MIQETQGFTLLEEKRRTVALKIDVIYRPILERMAMVGTGDECYFDRAEILEYWQRLPRRADGRIDGDELARRIEQPRTLTIENDRLDAHSILNAFLKVQTERELLTFLNGAGPFWPASRLTWREFLEWQKFVRCVRDINFPQSATSDPYAAEALMAVNGFPSSCFPASQWTEDDSIRDARSRFVERGETDPFIEARRHHEKMLRSLAMWFRRPRRLKPDFAVPGEHLPSDKELLEFSQPLSSKASARRRSKTQATLVALSKQSWFAEGYAADHDLTPALLIEPTCILEAIAAAMWVDRYTGVRYGKCEGCSKLFLKSSERERKYCSHGCKNKATQRAWRDRHKKKSKRAKKATLAK